MIFSKTTEELVTSHGYSQNLVMVWRTFDLEKVGVLAGHSKRVLFMDLSPNGESVVTGAGDETLRFWKVFPKQSIPKEVSSFALSLNDVR